MKEKMKYCILFLILIVVLIQGGCSQRNLSVTDYSEEVSQPEEPVEKEEFFPVSEVVDESTENKLVKDETIEDSQFLDIINSVIEITDGEEIARQQWVETGVVYRVLIGQTTDSTMPYYVRDYFFVKEEKIVWFKVEYPQNDDLDAPRHKWDVCDYTAEYIDVTFDGKKDIVISLGIAGTSAAPIHCAYINKDGDFVYEQSFERIPGYSVDNEEKCIRGWAYDGPYYLEYKAVFNGDGFVVSYVEESEK